MKYQAKFTHFHSRKGFWKYRLENGKHFVSASMYQLLRGIIGYTGGNHAVLLSLFKCQFLRKIILQDTHRNLPWLKRTSLAVDNIPWWRHQMETFSALLDFCAGNSPHKGQWCRALMFSLICARINSWVNNREAGDLRRHRAHDDVTVMIPNHNGVFLLGSHHRAFIH